MENLDMKNRFGGGGGGGGGGACGHKNLTHPMGGKPHHQGLIPKATPSYGLLRWKPEAPRLDYENE